MRTVLTSLALRNAEQNTHATAPARDMALMKRSKYGYPKLKSAGRYVSKAPVTLPRLDLK